MGGQGKGQGPPTREGGHQHLYADKKVWSEEEVGVAEKMKRNTRVCELGVATSVVCLLTLIICHSYIAGVTEVAKVLDVEFELVKGG